MSNQSNGVKTYRIDGKLQIELTVILTKTEYQKLYELTAFRSKDLKRSVTMAECIKMLIRASVPGGTGQRHMAVDCESK